MKITIYPNLQLNPATRPNPYIKDFISALSQKEGIEIVNKPHKNPLLSILKPSAQGEVFIFNWLEDVIFQKHGKLQWLAAFCLLILLHIRKKKIIWVFHNKSSHLTHHRRATQCLRRMLIDYSSLIITHAQEGVDLIKKDYPHAIDKVHYFNHPTKNRLNFCHPIDMAIRKYDILIWGTLSRYKGVIDFLQFIKSHHVRNLKICIVGLCPDKTLYEQLLRQTDENIYIFNEGPSFQKLATYMDNSRFVLIPYHAESILSSGILMDSLSFGAKIIGPTAGSFTDYTNNSSICVYTFHNFEEIPMLVKKYGLDEISTEKYHSFLDEYSWAHFADTIIDYILSLKKQR